MEKIKVLLADDHTIVRQGLRVLLEAEPDIAVVGEVGNGREAVQMEFMRNSEMRLTNKTYTDVAHLPLAEAADMLPKFTTGKGTQKGTHDSGGEGHSLSSAGTNPIRDERQKAVAVIGDCHGLTLPDAEGHELKLVHPSGVEPETF